MNKQTKEPSMSLRLRNSVHNDLDKLKIHLIRNTKASVIEYLIKKELEKYK